jgi:hypothetical protein
LAFLAITLADFGKAFQRCLDQGFVAPSDFPAFKRTKGRRTGLPAFLQGFLERVFDAASGALLEHPDVEAIYAVRQLSLMFSKIALPEESVAKRYPQKQGSRKVVSASRERRAMSDYVLTEQEVRASDSLLDPSYKADFKRMSEMLFG